jgi:hypothetical protein
MPLFFYQVRIDRASASVVVSPVLVQRAKNIIDLPVGRLRGL